MRILNFGSCNIDYVYAVEQIVQPGQTITTNSLEVFPGGKGLNQSIAVARAGVPVYHAGYIGADGTMLRDILQESGVDLTFLKEVDIPNGHAIIQVEASGENCIFLYSGTNKSIPKEYMDWVLGHFSEGDLLLLQNEINDIHYLVSQASKKGMQVVLNPAPFTQDLKTLDLNSISYLLLNETEAKEFSGTEDPAEFVSFVRSNYPQLKVVLTLGKQGCIYTDSQVTLAHPAFDVPAVDTTAAGDTFTGYFVAQLATGNTYAEAIKFASAAAAVTVSHMGAAPSIPVMAQVEEALKTLKPHSAENLKEKNQRKQIQDYLTANLTSANLQDLAQAMGYSDTYIGACVREIMGVSFSRLLQSMRCQTAAQLLLNTELSISEIISQVGYQNENFFRTKFKEQYGVTPNQYRKKR